MFSLKFIIKIFLSIKICGLLNMRSNSKSYLYNNKIFKLNVTVGMQYIHCLKYLSYNYYKIFNMFITLPFAPNRFSFMTIHRCSQFCDLNKYCKFKLCSTHSIQSEKRRAKALSKYLISNI